MLSRFLARCLVAPFARVRIIGREHTARRGAFILAANHISHFDPPVLSVAALRKLDWMAMVELFENRLVAAWLRGIETFPVDRERVDRAAVRTALVRLRRGHVVGMFPEGGIRDGATSVLNGAPMQPGISALAQMSGAPIVPCVILGTDRLYDAANWRRFRSVGIWIAFGEPIRCEAHGKEARAETETQLRAAFATLLNQLRERFGLSEDDLPQPPLRRKGRV